MVRSRSLSLNGPAACAGLALSLLACTGGAKITSFGGGAGSGGAGAGGSGGAPPARDAGPPPTPGFTFDVPDGGPPPIGANGKACDNLCRKQMQCPNGGDTTISGTVLAPTPPQFGSPDPIFNATVYVPNAPVQPFTAGVTCDMCTAPASGSPLVIAATGADGKFVLKNAPVADNVPLVVQVGRWRRQVTIPHVAPCADNPLPAELTRLPRTKAEGDIPQMAISTGSVDALECVLRKIGVDNSEFTLPTGDGRVHLYQANGATLGPNTPPAAQLTGSLDTLKRYDITILECEGGQHLKALADKQNALAYTNAGGRLFLTHYSYTWLFDMAPFMGTAAWTPDAFHPTTNDAALTGIIDQGFPKGVSFAQWLQIVGATAPVPGQIQINVPRHDLDAAMPPSQRWIYSTTPPTVQHFTFNTPVGAPEDQQCGRVLFSDFHVNSVPMSTPVFPAHCQDQPLTPQEKVIEFMLFDLSSCVQPDSKPPIIP
jgi:hypothetical protein